MPDLLLNDCAIALGMYLGKNAAWMAPFQQARAAAAAAITGQDISKVVDRATTRRGA